MRPGYALGIDIGGTKVSGGVVDESGRVVRRARRHTPDRSTSPRVVEDTIVSVVEELTAAVAVGDLEATPDTGAAGIEAVDPAGRTDVGAGPPADVTAIGIGAAGFVGADGATVVFAPHLSWRNEPLRDALSHRVGRPIHIENDANAAAWAEWRFGAARAESHLVMITLGTGIGGGVVTEGAVQRGKYGIAGEFGHMEIVPDGHRCECGNRGCWEQYASGNALVREAGSMIVAQSPIAQDLAQRVEAEPGGLTGPLITEAARAGDPTACELLAEIGHWLGVGLANIAAALDPGRFVVGGGVSAAGDLLLTPARETFRRKLTGRGYRPEAQIVQAALGNDAGLIGAADLARSEARAAGASGGQATRG